MSSKRTTPPVLPPPKNEKDFRENRLEMYYDTLGERKSMFGSKCLHGYVRAREMYYDALRLVYFLLLGEDFIHKIYPNYQNEIPRFAKKNHTQWVANIIVSMRRIGVSSYFLFRTDEALEIHLRIRKIILDFFEKFGEGSNFSRRWPVQNETWIGRFYLEKGNLEEAIKSAEIAEKYSPYGSSSWLHGLRELQENIEKVKKDGVSAIIPKNVKEFGIKELPEEYEKMIKYSEIVLPDVQDLLKKEDDLERERFEYTFWKDFLDQQDEHFVFKIVHDNFDDEFVLVWKSLIK